MPLYSYKCPKCQCVSEDLRTWPKRNAPQICHCGAKTYRLMFERFSVGHATPEVAPVAPAAQPRGSFMGGAGLVIDGCFGGVIDITVENADIGVAVLDGFDETEVTIRAKNVPTLVHNERSNVTVRNSRAHRD